MSCMTVKLDLFDLFIVFKSRCMVTNFHYKSIARKLHKFINLIFGQFGQFAQVKTNPRDRMLYYGYGKNYFNHKNSSL